MAGCKTVNLEAGMPTSDQAVRRLTAEMASSRRSYAALKLIHGYGSSGTGGRIRIEVRKYLARQKQAGKVKLVVPGEEFTIFEADTRALLAACPELRKEPDLERHNNGVTYVLL